MDINLGKVNITLTQFTNFSMLNLPAHVKGFGFSDGEITVVTTQDLTAKEKSDLVAGFLALPDSPIKTNELKRNAAKEVLDQPGPFNTVQRATLELMAQEINVLRAWLSGFKAEVAAATTLADLKTRVAGMPSTPARTKTQIVNAIKAEVDTGNAD